MKPGPKPADPSLGVRHCRRCDQDVLLEDFSKSKAAVSGFGPYCKACSRDHASKYRTMYAARHPSEISTPEEKRCTTCHVVKPRSEYWPNKYAVDGLYHACRSCKAAAQKKSYVKTIRPRLQYVYAARYGITPEAFDNLLASQKNRCQICQRDFSDDRRVRIDHDHSTGTARGLLCSACNVGLGLFGDSTERLHNAIDYLRRRGTISSVLENTPHISGQLKGSPV